MEALNLATLTQNRDLRYVKKHNSLIQLNRYIDQYENSSLSLIEAKLIAYALSKLDTEAKELHPIEIDFDEYWGLCGIKPDSKKHYMVLADAIMNLRNRATWVLKPHPMTGEPSAVPVSWLDGKPMLFNRRAIIKFDPDLTPALLRLKSNYTEYPLSSVMQLTSKYGFALYEFIASMEGVDQPMVLTLQRIAEICDACNYLNRPSDLKKRVILPALKDIAEHTPDYEVGYEFLKTGRVTTHVRLLPVRKELPPAGEEEKPLTEEQRWEKTLTEVKEQVGYESIYNKLFCEHESAKIRTLEMIVEEIAGVYAETQVRYTINGSRIPGSKVVERFKQLTNAHVLLIIDAISNNTTERIHNPIAYLRVVLFNAPLKYELQQEAIENRRKKRIPTGFDENGRRELDSDELDAIRRTMAEDNPSDDF